MGKYNATTCDDFIAIMKAAQKQNEKVAEKKLREVMASINISTFLILVKIMGEMALKYNKPVK